MESKMQKPTRRELLWMMGFGSIAIGAIGCLRGLQTKTGASAVGESTTSSVVTGMVMIIILDGVISAIYYVLGI